MIFWVWYTILRLMFFSIYIHLSANFKVFLMTWDITCVVGLCHYKKCTMESQSSFGFVFPWSLSISNISCGVSQPFGVPLLKSLCLKLYSIFKLYYLLFWYKVSLILYILLYYFSIVCRLAKTLFPFFHFVWMMVSFTMWKLLIRIPVLIFVLTVYDNGILFQNYFPVFMISRLFLTFSSTRLSILGFILKSLIHFVLSFEKDDSSTCSHCAGPVSSVAESIFCTVFISVLFIKIKVQIAVSIYLWVFNQFY